MKVYRGIVKGNTILLKETPDLPDECPALGEIKLVGQPVANCDRFTKTPNRSGIPFFEVTICDLKREGWTAVSTLRLY